MDVSSVHTGFIILVSMISKEQRPQVVTEEQSQTAGICVALNIRSLEDLSDVDTKLQTESSCRGATEHEVVELCSSTEELRWDPEINKAVMFGELAAFYGWDLTDEEQLEL